MEKSDEELVNEAGDAAYAVGYFRSYSKKDALGRYDLAQLDHAKQALLTRLTLLRCRLTTWWRRR